MEIFNPVMTMIVMDRRRGTKPQWQVKIAQERIAILFSEAEKAACRDPALARRYIMLARKIGMRYNVRFTRAQKRACCRHCRAYLLPGRTCATALAGGAVNIKCFACNKTNRYPYK